MWQALNGHRVAVGLLALVLSLGGLTWRTMVVRVDRVEAAQQYDRAQVADLKALVASTLAKQVEQLAGLDRQTIEQYQATMRRLDRIEAKLDRLSEHRGGRE